MMATSFPSIAAIWLSTWRKMACCDVSVAPETSASTIGLLLIPLIAECISVDIDLYAGLASLAPWHLLA